MDNLIVKAIAARRESKTIEFKECFDGSQAHWCEILKDIVALANSGGGAIVVGVDNGGRPTNADLAALINLDPAVLADKIHSYTGTHFSDIEIGQHTKAEADIVLILVTKSECPMVFTRPGTYDIGQGRQKNSFSAGTVYFRHGAKSEPGTSDDLRRVIERKIDVMRRGLLRGVRKVIGAPAGSHISVLPPEVIQSDSPNAAPIKIVDDPAAPAYRVIDPNVTHPLRLKDILASLSSNGGSRINTYDLLAVRRVHSIDDNPSYFYKPIAGSPQYSSIFCDWLIDASGTDPEFFRKARLLFSKKIS